MTVVSCKTNVGKRESVVDWNENDE
jgi:hypothetical protein